MKTKKKKKFYFFKKKNAAGNQKIPEHQETLGHSILTSGKPFDCLSHELITAKLNA